MRPFALLLFSALLLGCDPPGGSGGGSAQNPPAPPPFAWAGDYIITNSNKIVVPQNYGNYFAGGHTYSAHSVYLGTLHVSADGSASIASIEADRLASRASHRIDFGARGQDPDNPPASIAETAYNLTIVNLNDGGNNYTSKVPASYERIRHKLTLVFKTPPGRAGIWLEIPAGTSASAPWTSGSTLILANVPTEESQVTLQRKSND